MKGLKKILTSELSLIHYDTQLQIIAATDASEYDTGAVIGHTFEEGTVKAVAHASRSLTNTGKCYSQIENEALAMTFDIMKFHRMI